jgi:hypothetical protein
LNVIKKYGVFDYLRKDGILFAPTRGSKYLCIATKRFKFLDLMNYTSPGESFDSVCKSFKTKVQKGIFPYEFMSSFAKLEIPLEQLTQADFRSELRGTDISNEDWMEFSGMWRGKGFTTIRHLLEFYNNCDVEPFIELIPKMNAFYKDHKLDMMIDSITLPGLEKPMMLRHLWNEEKESGEGVKGDGVKPFEVPLEWAERKIWGYRKQDEEAGRGSGGCLTTANIIKLVDIAGYKCHYCQQQLTLARTTMDRVSNNLSHLNSNCVVACIKCNTSRSNTPYPKFKALADQRVQASKMKNMMYTISEENKAVYYGLRRGVVGGPSIVFHRYHEAGKTRIRHPVYKDGVWGMSQEGKLVKSIIGYDAAALYLWAINNIMPCGELTHHEYTGTPQEFVDNIDQWFGFAEVDIEVPEHLRNDFSSMTPIFKNISVSVDEVGDGMRGIIEGGSGQSSGGRMRAMEAATKDRKLVGSMEGTKILLYHPLIKWYLEHGLVITRVYNTIDATPGRPFTKFADEVSDARRRGDVDKSESVIASMMKLVGNSAFEGTAINRNKFSKTEFSTIPQAQRAVNKWTFRKMSYVGGETWQVEKYSAKVKQNMEIQCASAIFQLAKLRMLQFSYDFLDKYIAREDRQLMYMDTDSSYMALTALNIEEVIKPEMRAEYEADKDNWLPRTDTPGHVAYDKRTPGLFKVEWYGKSMVALSSKSYFCQPFPDDKAHKEKCSVKGVNRGPNVDILNNPTYKDVLESGKSVFGTNITFTQHEGNMKTLRMHKKALTSVYIKRRVMGDGYTTCPLDEGYGV